MHYCEEMSDELISKEISCRFLKFFSEVFPSLYPQHFFPNSIVCLFSKSLFVLIILVPGKCLQVQSLQDHRCISFVLFSEITVLLVVQCLKTNVSCILSNILIVYGGRASLVPVTLISKMQKTTVTNFYKCNLYKTILLNFLITPKETK